MRVAGIDIEGHTLPFSESDPHRLARSFLGELKRRDIAAAAQTLSALVVALDWIEVGFFARLLQAAEDHSDALLDALLAAGRTTFSRLPLLARALELGWKLGRFEAVTERIAALEASHNMPLVRFTNRDLLSIYAKAPEELFREIVRLKYPFTGTQGSRSVSELAEVLSARYDLPARALCRLRDNTAHSNIQYEEWKRRISIACCVDQMSVDSALLARRFRHDEIRNPLVRLQFPVSVDGDALPPRAPTGSLFVFLHSGFPLLVVEAYRRIEPTGLIVRNGPAGRAHPANHIVVSDPRAATFLMTRAIEDGRSILMAPDAPIGKRDASIRVFGQDFPIAQGAPFVAFETSCQTVWISMQRNGDLFVPCFALGPVRTESESYKSFKARWLTFYGEQVEGFLRGAPDSLSIRPYWSRWLNQGA